jgi:hypothetical protein
VNSASFLVGLVAFLIYVSIFIVLLRLKWRLGWLYSEIFTGIAVHLLSSVTGFIWIQDFSYWYNASLYAFLWFCFFFVTSIYSVSVTVGVIRYLFQQPGYVASNEDIYQHCIVSTFMERSEFLAKNKQVQKKDGGYIISFSGRRTVNNLVLVQKILGMESQGFYSQQLEVSDKNN